MYVTTCGANYNKQKEKLVPVILGLKDIVQQKLTSVVQVSNIS